ncbi:hypothetical protein [Gellertiella hungarica]|uniref:Uncharacterized protein n=1 Tax=Gellertiella hungarica TaxID=1572859 RepID=A0A7W6NJF7_9HYPH|nr:hypothetical protein [Gellertiella hungarica]MBB4063683.1 hypothetical protein [Gellertiella hungarica]
MFTISVKRKNPGAVQKLARALTGPRQVKVGFPAGAADGDVINRAVWNEFGTRGGASGGGWGGPIPERPFMRNAMRDNLSKYRNAMKSSAAPILLGKSTLRQTLSKLGILAQSDIQGEITALTSPANSPVTVERKGSSKPLIDTGEMRASVTWKVDE